MILILSTLLLFSVILKLFPPRKRNYLYGYQLGSAKKSLKHWKVANRYASSYMIIFYASTLFLYFIFKYQNYNFETPILIIIPSELILIYLIVEKKLKKIDLETSNKIE